MRDTFGKPPHRLHLLRLLHLFLQLLPLGDVLSSADHAHDHIAISTITRQRAISVRRSPSGRMIACSKLNG